MVSVSEQAERAERFLALHQSERPLLMPNPWDAGSARLLTFLGFEALATTSSGHAATRGRLDYRVTREEALENAAAIVAVTALPVSADLENCYAADPDGVAETIRLRSAPGSPAARSRTSPATRRRRSTICTRRPTEWSPRPRRHTPVRCGWC